MSEEKDLAQKEAERLLKSLNRPQKSAAERKKEEAERQRKIEERKKREDEERIRVEAARKKMLQDKEEARLREAALEKEQELKNKNVARTVDETDSDSATPENARRERERLEKAFRGNIPSGNPEPTVITTPIVEANDDGEKASIAREEERMAKMFGQKSPRNLDNVPPALRSNVTVDPNPHVVLISPRSDAPLPPALRTGKGETSGPNPPAVKTVVVPAAVKEKPDAVTVGKYSLPAHGSEATVELDCNASRKFWTVKVLPCKYPAQVTVQIAGGTVDFLAEYNGGTHPRSVDLPLLVKLRPDCIDFQGQDQTGLTFQIHV